MTTETAALRLIVGLFEASPNQAMFSSVQAQLGYGATLPELASAWLAGDLLQSPYYYPATLSDHQFAGLLVQRLLGLGEGYDWGAATAASDAVLARDWLQQQVASSGRGAATVAAIEQLCSTDAPAFAAARQHLLQQVTLAQDYLDSGAGSTDLVDLRAVLADPGSHRTPTDPAATGAGTWTVMVYMAADCDLEAYALQDLNELEAAVLPAGSSVAVLLDRIPGYDASEGNGFDTRTGIVRHDTDTDRLATQLVSVGECNTGDPAQLTRFIDWASAARPADHYALVLWGHGAGHKGVAFDQSQGNDRLTPNELHAAIADSVPGRLDWVGFDSCNMATLEVSSSLAGLADLMVASQELEPASGWDYTDWLDRSFGTGSNAGTGTATAASSPTAEALAQAAVQSMAALYRTDPDLSLSALALAEQPALLHDLQDFCALAQHASAADWQQIGQALRQSRHFADTDAVDLQGFFYALALAPVAAALGRSAQQNVQALDALVLARSDNEPSDQGLSIYAPDTRPAGFARDYSPAVLELLGVLPWHDFLEAYWLHA